MAIQTVKTGAAVNDGTGDDARTCFTKINQNFTDSANAASRLVGKAAGNVMEVGAFGLGATNNYNFYDSAKVNTYATGFYGVNKSSSPNIDTPGDYGQMIMMNQSGWMHRVFFPANAYEAPSLSSNINNTGWTAFRQFLIKGFNTSTDANGFIKAASPIVKLFADKIELNDEAKLQQITFEKLGVGDYLVKGSTGFAQEGWYIEMPKDANGNVLVAVVYEQLDNNDISVKTYAKIFDPDTGDIVPNTARPRDIPATRWIDIRLESLPQPDIKPFSTNDMVNTNA